MADLQFVSQIEGTILYRRIYITHNGYKGFKVRFSNNSFTPTVLFNSCQIL